MVKAVNRDTSRTTNKLDTFILVCWTQNIHQILATCTSIIEIISNCFPFSHCCMNGETLHWVISILYVQHGYLYMTTKRLTIHSVSKTRIKGKVNILINFPSFWTFHFCCAYICILIFHHCYQFLRINWKKL